MDPTSETDSHNCTAVRFGRVLRRNSPHWPLVARWYINGNVRNFLSSLWLEHDGPSFANRLDLPFCGDQSAFAFRTIVHWEVETE